MLFNHRNIKKSVKLISICALLFVLTILSSCTSNDLLNNNASDQTETGYFNSQVQTDCISNDEISTQINIDTTISTDNVDEITNSHKFTGFFLQTETQTFFIAESDTETFYQGEVVKISIPAWIDDKTVCFDNYTSGDKIKVEILQIEDSLPRSMPIYSIELIEEGTIENISKKTIQYIEEIGFIIKK
ncbi:MAG: DUF3221 domain-containing protein [Ruminococcaceae bacterium]|nr:DUF3221 domain-containing protein [Oscillospiraceae bacterium]